MPVLKNQSVRLRIIDQLVRNPKRHYGRKELLNALNERLKNEGYAPIALRQLQKDINFMRSDASGHAAPLDYNRKLGYYEYTEPGYSIQSSLVKAADLGVIHQAVAILRQFSGLGYGEELAGILQRLEKQVSQEVSPPLSVLEFEQVPLKGLELLYDLHQVILNAQSIEVRYQPYHHEEPSTWVVHPYYLKEFNHRWFLMALSEEERYVMTLALDRMEYFSVVEVPYIYNTEIDFKERFKHVLGITIPRTAAGEEISVEHIRLRFNPKRGNYVRTKPIHFSQKVLSDTEEGLEISLDLIPNQELLARLLSFGADVEVLAPLSLWQQIQVQYEEALRMMGVRVE